LLRDLNAVKAGHQLTWMSVAAGPSPAAIDCSISLAQGSKSGDQGLGQV
jgi:hypothetical protein